MTSVVDAWRAVDPDARLVSGDAARLGRPLRSVIRTRSLAPHLPPPADLPLLVADAALLPDRSLERLLASLAEAGLEPVAVIIGGADAPYEAADAGLPVLASLRPVGPLFAEAEGYLADEGAVLSRLRGELRLACAEAALADPQPAVPAGLIASRCRRGVAVSVDGRLESLHARPAGRALAARFAALHERLLATASGSGAAGRRSREGLRLLERRIRPGASAWLFDDLPFAAVDEVAAEALTVTLRALLRRPPATAESDVTPISGAHREASHPDRPPADPLDATLLAVARANGRVAPAARQLGVHRNTVLYRLRRAAAERGVDPRRPADALRILGEAQHRE